MSNNPVRVPFSILFDVNPAVVNIPNIIPIPPPPRNFIITETGNSMISETGNRLITE